jgi:peptidoglycan/LPS O-acetylase OafA/YrhL
MKSSNTIRPNNFNIIRLIASVQVMIDHGVYHLNLESSWLLALNKALSFIPGVPIFFISSGFLIFNTYLNSQNTTFDFFRNRFLRIFPALVPATFISLLLVVYFSTSPVGLINITKWIVGQLTLGQFYTPDSFKFYGVGNPNGSLWTISTELQFYILVPLVIYFLVRTKQKLIFFMVLILASIYANYALYPLYIDDELIGKFAGISFLPYWYLFLSGGLLNYYWNNVSKLFRNKLFIWLTVFVLFSFSLLLLNIDYNAYWYTNGVKFFNDILLIGLVMSFAYSTISIPAPSVDLSYGIYIYHMVIINVFVVLGLHGNQLYFGFLLVLTTVLAYASWLFIEAPAFRRKVKTSKA